MKAPALRTADFQNVYRNGRSKSDPHFVLYHLNKEDGPFRLGVVASKKVGNSVIRHRIKRRVKEAIRNYRDEFPGQGDLVVIAKRPAAEASYESICRSLCGLSARLK